MSYDSILYEEQGEIGILTLNLPEKRNALGIHAETEITECLQDAAKRHAAKVIILRANGPVFCAGHDRPEIVNQPVSNIRRLFQTSFNLMSAIRNAPQCIIAEVHAIAMAGGCHLVAGCDLITAARDKAQFGMTGLIYSYNCTTPTVAVSRAVGQKKCMEMLMTAKLRVAKMALRKPTRSWRPVPARRSVPVRLRASDFGSTLAVASAHRTHACQDR